MAPGDLERAGYIKYVAVVDGTEMTLWRKPGGRHCTNGDHQHCRGAEFVVETDMPDLPEQQIAAHHHAWTCPCACHAAAAAQPVQLSLFDPAA